MRSGTLNVTGIVGVGKACELAGAEMAEEGSRVLALRERLRAGISARLEGVVLNGHPSRRLPGNLNLSFTHVEGEALLMGLREIALSSGSACTSATLQPSHVLRAIGTSDELAQSSIRFGLGRYNTAEEVDFVVARVAEEVTRLRAMSPAHAAAKRRAAAAAAGRPG
jgi:cysteine desulfurase